MDQSPLPGLYIRRAVRQDLPEVLELVRLLETDGRVLDLDSAGQLFARFQSYPNCTLYVAEYQETVIGMFVLLIMDNLAHLGAPSGILEDLVVKESFQGKGVGKYMLDFVMQACREASCYKLVLSSSLQRTAAHRFYTNLGFRQYGYCFEIKFRAESSSSGETNG